MIYSAALAAQPHSAVEKALCASQANVQAHCANSKANRQREQLTTMFEQAPAMICVLEGPMPVFQFVNLPYVGR